MNRYKIGVIIMKIYGQIPKISEIYNKDKNVSKASKTGGVESKKDVVSISTQGKDFQTALKAAREAADIRQDKVDEIKQRIATDTYTPSGKDIADKVIQSIFDRKF
jgi:negative regulator of flagellin synthesis FlgM